MLCFFLSLEFSKVRNDYEIIIKYHQLFVYYKSLCFKNVLFNIVFHLDIKYISCDITQIIYVHFMCATINKS